LYGIDHWLGTAKSPAERSRPLLAIAAISVAMFPEFYALGPKAAAVSWGAIFNQDGPAMEYRCKMSPGYGMIAQQTMFLMDSEAVPGPIQVFGSPLYWYLSGRLPAVTPRGEESSFRLWEDLPHELRGAQPPYIYVDSGYAKLIAMRSERVRRWIANEYVEIHRDVVGTWYQNRQSRPLAVPAADVRLTADNR